jgi:hypothetical protein
MFFASGTFGHESEVREANKRQTGRRHQPRDMSEGQTASAGGNATAIGAGSAVAKRRGGGGDAGRHMNDQKQMSSGPSFMDRMYAHDASAGEPTHAARRHNSGPKDNLNIFSWQERDNTQKPPVGRGPRAARNVDATIALPTVEDRRAQESKKFETHSESTFLKFSDTPVNGGQGSGGAPIRAGRRACGSRQPHENGLMGELMRDQQERPHGKRIQVEQQAYGKRKGGAGPADPGVAGFPGMGKRSTPCAVPHINRKQLESNVFPPSSPPWAQHDEVAVSRNTGAEGSRSGGAPPTAAPPATSMQPAYRLDEDDYEDQHYAGERGGDAEGVAPYQGQQHHMQEIEMYDDDEDNHVPAMRQQQRQPQWLDETEHAGNTRGESPSVQQRRYSFNPEEQEFHEDEANYHDHHKYD